MKLYSKASFKVVGFAIIIALAGVIAGVVAGVVAKNVFNVDVDATVTSGIIAAVTGLLGNTYFRVLLAQRATRESLYMEYLESFQNWFCNPYDRQKIGDLTACRMKFFVVASEEVIKELLKISKDGVSLDDQIKSFQEMIKLARKDLEINDKDFPNIEPLKY